MARKTQIAKSDADAAAEAAMNETPDVDRESDDTADAKAKGKTPKWSPLEADRAAWIAANARPAIAPCLCGCGGTTKGRFVPGHDATLKQALVVSAEAGDENAKAALVTFGW